MTTAQVVLDESDYLAHLSPDTEPDLDHVGCGCVPVFREDPQPCPASAARSLRPQGAEP